MASHQLDTILQHSQLNVKHTIASVINVIDQLLQDGFRPDQYETYNNHLSILRDFISYLSSKDPTRGKDKNVVQGDSDDVSIQSEAFQKVCLPMLNNLFPSQNSNPEILVVLGNTAKLTAACVVNNKALFSVVIEFIISNVETFIREGPSKFNLLEDRSTPDISTRLEVLRYVLSVTTSLGSLEKTDLDKLLVLFDKLTQTVSNISNEIIGTSCIPVLLKILNTGADYDRLLNKVWESAKQCHTEAERKEYLLLCGFANHFFPVNGQLRNTTTIDVRKDGMFWSMLQTGLYCKDSLTRKRSLYLIKRIVDICESNAVDFSGDDNKVFWWTKEKRSALSKVWEDFMLLAEVLEEKQVHVIKPLLPRMKNLVTASCLNKDNDTPLLHTSWLKTVLLRCSHHESLQIIRWSADTVLSLDLTKCPMIQQGLDKYLAGEMLYSLQEPKLYIKEAASPVGTFPVIADKLVQYFNTCCMSLSPDKRDSFFNLTLRNIAAKDWGPISLLFICRGLAMVPQCPCLDRETVLSLRRLLTGFLVTMDTYFRGAIQCYIVQILIKLTDKSKVPLEDFMQILSLVRQEESLQRGTTLWGQCVTWLSEEPTDQSAWSSEGIRQYLEATVGTYLQTTIDSKYSVGDSTTAGSVARLLLLASDASIATKEDDAGGTTLQRITDCLVGVLNSINTHSYMSVHKADKALLLLMSIVTESATKGCESDDNMMRTIYTAVEHCSSEIAVYVCRQMFDAVTSLDDIGVMYLYMDSVEMITKSIRVKCCPYWSPLVDKCVNILSKPSENVGMTGTLHQLASMCVLGKLSNVLINVEDKRYTELIDNICSLFKSWKVVSNFSKPVGVQSLSHQEWGRVTSLFQQQQWQVVMLALHQRSSACWFDIQELLTVAEDTLSVGLEQTTCIVLRCLKLIIPKVKGVISKDRLVVILTTCWSCLQEARRLLAFWDVLESFVQAIFQPCLLEMDEESPVVIKLTEFAEEMIEIGTDKNGVVNALSTQLYNVLSQPDMIQHTGKYTSVIVNLCKFGGLVRRGVRQVYDICAALEQDGKACPVNELMKGMRNEDIGVRVAVSSLLCALNPDVPAHCNIATSVVKSCYQCYYDIAKSSTNKFANSQVHRQRHRLIQTVLLLQQFVTDDYAEDIWSLLWSSLEFETQPSIRHMLEWLILWMMYKHDTFRPQLWNLFEKYRDSKNLTLCSLLCIVIHLGPHLPKHEQIEYYKKAMPYILPWCMAHHFQTRIYSQAVLAKLWDQCRLLGLDEVLKENAILQCIMDFTQENRNSTKNVKKLLDSFVFKYLDFERDFTIQTLFYVMPKMTALTGEDWIIPEFFIDLNPAWADDTASRIIRLRNHSSKFDNCDPGLWKYTGLKVPEDDEVADDTVTEEGEGDVQKKIMPWRQMMIDEDVVSEVDHGVKQLTEHGLVVVTSLINKIPNLGGLCRTSEIFGVSEYVMSKLGYTEDKAFQGLSVTAHKWLPLTEVPEVKLEDFLQQKRLEGYTLVGVEQTANSVSLSDYTFPEKTLLLLGNEKEGIPVELISHLDVCVEIPQQGVVRSLNVHVSGAILIWEYRRQQLMKPIT